MQRNVRTIATTSGLRCVERTRETNFLVVPDYVTL